MKEDFKKVGAFTLAETLITLTILGIVAAITVPGLVRKQVERANRTKVKKAMTAYEKALNNIIIENNLSSNQALQEFGNAGTCDNTRKYFKSVKDGYDNCTFKTADGIWWNISNIENPVISLKNEITSDNIETMKSTTAKNIKEHTVFAMVGRRDAENGILRINDNSYEQQKGTADQKAYMTKLYRFMLADEDFNKSTFEKNCAVDPSDSNKCTLTYKCPTAENPTRICTQEYIKTGMTKEVKNSSFCDWDPQTKVCTAKAKSESEDDEDVWIAYLGQGSSGTWAYSDSKSNEVCAESRSPYCSTTGDYWTLARKNCEAQGMRLANYAELQSLNKAGKLQYGSSYWAAETYSNSDVVSSWNFITNYRHYCIDGVRAGCNEAICVGK